MSKTLVNLTEKIVVQEIEMILETYPLHPYQEAYANADLRQSLIAYILTRVPNNYISVDPEEQILISADYLHQYVGQISQMEAIIRQGIEAILNEQAEEVRRHIPEIAAPGFVPSDWFG
ncbi:MAG: late competence development ComFB family protein [Goleter apudmare HA4340-LM2]|jgi:hypothetical protein|nr:late competence development ComFB family protein [Goleter apudmare HA4340-LM2]